MATKIWKIEKDLCRCCHAEGAFDNLAEPRTFLEKEEVYSDMLKECLDIDIPPVPGELCSITYTICNDCIVRLRDACNFKKQVQDCEQRFMTLYYKNAIQGIKPETKVKEELEVTIIETQSDAEQDIVFKKEDEDDDDDHLMGGDDDDMSDDDIPIKQSLMVMKTRPKPKPKPKAPPVKKEKPPPKQKKKEVPKKKEPAKEKKGTRALPDGDYRRDGSNYICNYCDLTQDSLSEMVVHSCTESGVSAADYKKKDGELICSYCRRRFKTMSGLRSHLFEKTQKCPFCEMRFCIKSRFVIHKLKVHNVDERINCHACGGKFNSKMALDRHLNVFHQLGEMYNCDKCTYETRNRNNLHRHKLVHTKVKRHQCSFCDKSFIRSGNLRLHEKIHTNVRTKVCRICQRAFVQKASLNYHMMKYHPEVPF